MMASRNTKGLGKGLNALFGDFPPESEQAGRPSLNIPIQRIEPNPYQPRKRFDEEELQALADSISRHGVIQPLTVRRLHENLYQIVAGERRWRAARLAGLTEVPAVVIEADDKKATELALIENLQREDLNPVDEAMGYQSLIEEYDMTQEQVSERVGKSRPAVANALRLLSLPEYVLEMVADGRLSAGHARAVMSLKDEREQEAAAEKIASLDLTVRQAEALCKGLAKERPPKPEPDPLVVDYIAECEKNLSRQLGRGVKITNGRRKGRVELEFYGQDDLQTLLEALEAIQSGRQ